jgi:plastocyanin
MSKIFIISRRQLFFAAILLIMMIASSVVWFNEATLPVTQQTTTRTIHMVTGEFNATSYDGKKIEAYRWDPGTVFVQQGETVELRITGVNGARHPFEIEKLNISGEVEQGKETVVSFTAKERGTYRMICLTHSDLAHDGPMIAYIVVQ